MTKLVIVCVMLFSAWSACAHSSYGAEVTGERSEFRVAGYLPNYRFVDLDTRTLDGLTDVIVFSAEPRADGTLNLDQLSQCPWETLLRYKTRHRVRLILTIGGWDRSTHFPEVAASAQKRKAFVDAVVRTALDNRLDGIDIDWEHPHDEAEREAYGKLLSDLKAAFKPHALQLSVTVAAWQGLTPEMIAAVDFVQVMAYDHDGEHSTFSSAARDVQTVLDNGVPTQKIVLGLPFYGRNVTDRSALTYAEIVAAHRPPAGTDRIGELYFNGPSTIQRKVQYAMRGKLGGVMIWELGQDVRGEETLMGAIRAVVGEFDGK